MQLDLTQLDWTLVGWNPYTWAWLKGRLTDDLRKHQATPPIPARLPGSVQDDLLRAGLIPDWNAGLNARACEWVEHRHWEYSAQVRVPAEWAGQRIVLRAEGLDYEGHILVDGVDVAAFHGMHIPHEFDLSDNLQPGGTYRLSIIFEEAPHEQGQIGYTSRSHFFKARYVYGWDWCTRLVPLGIWDKLTLMAVGPTRLHGCLPYADYDVAAREGHLSFRLDVETPALGSLSCRIALRDGERLIAEALLPCAFGAGRTETCVALPEALAVEPWWPNGMGPQQLYSASLQLETANGERLAGWEGRVGFKRVCWLPCEGAPANAEPWICQVNGRPLFLQGVNWVPVRMTYGSVTREMNAKRLELYADLGINLLRVWGGGVLERADFYELCDELGLLVWQEFPLSSSGVENMPPHAPEALAELASIATSYVWRRGGHASLLLWCGGNELFDEAYGATPVDAGATPVDAGATPVDAGDVCIGVLAGVCARLAPDKRFLPTSPSGPSMWFDPQRAGEGLHHDVHGPWMVPESMESWRAYWDSQDALFVSEVGVPSCSSVELLQRYAGEFQPWPPTVGNPYWTYRAPWWIEWERLAGPYGFEEGREELARFVEVSQQVQAEALVYLVQSCKRRFPRCGGVMFWMGHDLYPCPSNNSIVDFDGEPKLAVQALKPIFRSAP